MRLGDIAKLDGFISAERYVNVPKYSKTAQINEVEDKYHPRFGQGTFRLPYFYLNSDQADITTDHPSEEAVLSIGQTLTGVRFFVHPAMWPDIKQKYDLQRAKSVTVAPTSSTRTVVLLESEPGLMIKTHLDKRISRFIRRLRGESVRHSVAISNELRIATGSLRAPASFAYLPESIGVIWKEPTVDFGYLVRERLAAPLVKEERFLLPIFSLYSPDTRNLADKPLLIQLAKANHTTVFDFVMENIIDPLLESWAFAYLRYGMLLESHAQNTLLEVDVNFKPQRIVHRDFQSTPVDPEIRCDGHLVTPFRKHVIGREDYPRFYEQSLMYDHFIGDYLFRALEAFCCKQTDYSKEQFRHAIKAIFHRYMPTAAEHFPKEHIVFGEHLAEDNVYHLIPSAEAPIYR